MTPSLKLTHELVAALDVETALTNHYAGAKVVPYELTSIRKRVRVLTADLKAALATPDRVPLCKWTPSGPQPLTDGEGV